MIHETTSDGYSLFHNVYFHVKDYIIPTTNILSIAMVSFNQRFRYVIDSYMFVHVKLPNVSVSIRPLKTIYCVVYDEISTDCDTINRIQHVMKNVQLYARRGARKTLVGIEPGNFLRKDAC